MINNKCPVGQRIEQFFDLRIRFIYLVRQFIIILPEIIRIIRIQCDKSVQCIPGNRFSSGNGTPDMRVYPTVMMVVMCSLSGMGIMIVCIMPIVMFFCSLFQQIKSFRSIEERQFRIILTYLIHPRQFEADMPDLQVSDTSADLYHLLGSRVVRLRTLSGGNHTIDLKFISRYLLCKITLGFDRNSYDLLIRLFGHTGRQQKDREDSDQYTRLFHLLFLSQFVQR